jgi:hypothetical protein
VRRLNEGSLTLCFADEPTTLGASQLLEVDSSFPFFVSEVTRDAEVGDLQIAIEIHEEVVWLEVAMSDEILMKICQGTHELAGNGRGERGRSSGT